MKIPCNGLQGIFFCDIIQLKIFIIKEGFYEKKEVFHDFHNAYHTIQFSGGYFNRQFTSLLTHQYQKRRACRLYRCFVYGNYSHLRYGLDNTHDRNDMELFRASRYYASDTDRRTRNHHRFNGVYGCHA